MMTPLLLSLKRKQDIHKLPMSLFYTYIGISRQGVHQAALAYDKREEMVSKISLMTNTYRQKVDYRAGSRSLYYNLNIKQVFSIGITKFERLMSDYGLSLKPLRIRIITTKSVLRSYNYPNLTNGLVIDNINMLVVGDLTYIYINGKRYFLFCLTDVYSARIVGHCVHVRMRAIEAKKAFDMWVKLRKKQNLSGCIHHTDGGSQYFSELYLSALDKINAIVSCAKNCLQNGYAEQRNNIIKNHLLPTLTIDNQEEVDKGISKLISKYNQKRKQEALGWLSPVEFEKYISETDHRQKHKLFNFAENENGF